MATHPQLHCPSSCPEGLFEAINATMIVHRDGSYAGHDAHNCTFLCVTCRGVAIDLTAAAREMVRDRSVEGPTLTCPSCGSVMLPPEDDPLASRVECPACEQRFFIEEGMPRLHGGGAHHDDEAGG